MAAKEAPDMPIQPFAVIADYMAEGFFALSLPVYAYDFCICHDHILRHADVLKV